MSTLDTPIKNVDERDVPFLPTALRYGLIGGMVSIVLTLIINIFNLSNPADGFTALSGLLSLLGIGIYIGVGIMAVNFHRDQELDGYVSYGRAFMTSFVALIIMGVIGGIFTFVYMNYIDPTFVDGIMEATAEAYEKQGLSASQIEAAMTWVEWAYSPTMMIIFNVLVGPIFMSALFSAIIGAATKKKAPNA